MGFEMKKKIINTGIVLASIVFSLVFVEILMRIYFFTARGHRNDPARLLAEERLNPLSGLGQHSHCDWLGTLYPHPTLGFVQHNLPPCGIHINEQSVYGREFPPKGEAYVVLMLGGSVASHIVSAFPGLQINWLEEELNRRFYSPSKKPFAVINGAMGAWKHPNQMLRMASLNSRVDAFVTIEGFNEAQTISQRKQLESVAFPYFLVAGLPDVDRGIIPHLLVFRKFMQRWQVLESSYLVLTTYFQLKKIAVGRFNRLVNDSHLARIYDYPAGMSMREKLDAGFAQYHDYITAMDALATGYRKPISFFLQPIPSLYKPLHESDWPSRKLFETDLYLRLEKEILGRKYNKMKVHSALRVFEKNSDWIYKDDVHPWIDPRTGESPGYRQLAAFIAEEIGKDWKLKKR
jgi:hypothetical protein